MTSDAVYLSDSRTRLADAPSHSDDKGSSAHLDEVTDENLMGEVGRGSKEALGLLFRRYRAAVLSVVNRILRDSSEAEDLCQEVFIYLFQKAERFDPYKGSASSWIIQIAYHRAMNRRQYLLHRQHYNTQQLDDEQVGVERQPLLTDAITARNLLDRLPEQLSEGQRETLELHFFEGYSLREIAEKTGQTLGNTRNHFYRGLDRLRSLVFPQKAARVRELEQKSGRPRQPL
jgi:RNA polymerase sigma-70 factor, ECF subfamily